jgi:hypothetical protein
MRLPSTLFARSNDNARLCIDVHRPQDTTWKRIGSKLRVWQRELCPSKPLRLRTVATSGYLATTVGPCTLNMSGIPSSGLWNAAQVAEICMCERLSQRPFPASRHQRRGARRSGVLAAHLALRIMPGRLDTLERYCQSMIRRTEMFQ